MDWPRWLGCFLAVMLLPIGRAQTAPPPDLFNSLKTQVTVRVSKHPTGADLVEVTALDPDYPPEVLRAQTEKMCLDLGSPARGLQVFRQSLGATGSGGDLNFLKATFGTTGILNGAKGIRLEPLVRAFAGGAGHASVEGIDVIVSGVTPLPDTLGRYDSKEVVVQGLPPAGTVLEYRIKLLSQDPATIIIPDRADPPPPKAAAAEHTSWFQGPIIWILIAVGALAAGAIVYNLALRSAPRTGRGSGSVHK